MPCRKGTVIGVRVEASVRWICIRGEGDSKRARDDEGDMTGKEESEEFQDEWRCRHHPETRRLAEGSPVHFVSW
jgi:hypothetical protein